MNTKRGVVLVLEGLPGAGKTSLGEALGTKGWVYLPEVATIATRHGIVVGPKANLFSEIYIVNQEIRREEQAKVLKEKGENVVLDNFYGLNLAYAKARSTCNKTINYDIQLLHYQAAKLTNTLLEPDMYICLNIPVEESIRRQKARNKPELASLDKNFLELVEEYLDDFHNLYEPEIPRVVLDGTRSVDELVHSTEKIVAETGTRKNKERRASYPSGFRAVQIG